MPPARLWFFNYNGRIIYKKVEKEQVKTLTIDKADLMNGRSKLPFLKDMDSFSID